MSWRHFASVVGLILGWSVLCLVSLSGVPEVCLGPAKFFWAIFLIKVSVSSPFWSSLPLFIKYSLLVSSSWSMVYSYDGPSFTSFIKISISYSLLFSSYSSSSFDFLRSSSKNCATASSLGLLAHISQFLNTSIWWYLRALSRLAPRCLLHGDKFVGL